METVETENFDNFDDPEERFKDILTPLREAHGRIAFWVLDAHGLVVIAKPRNRKAYGVMVAELRNDKLDASVALEKFAMACVLYPEKDNARAIFNDLPAFATQVANRGVELAGGDIKEAGKG